MELPRRQRDDVYLSDGAFRAKLESLRRFPDVGELTACIVYAFDQRTHMLPYWYADKRMAPCSARLLADVLNAAGLTRIRVVLQQWTPNFRPSEARLDGRPLDILLVSAMQVHAEPAYDLIRQAHELGEQRPLILAGGPKAIYEPTDYLDLGPRPGVGADCAVTGEAYVLLELLERLLAHRQEGESLRRTFETSVGERRLEDIPGLVYLRPDPIAGRQVAVNTGVQRLLRDLDEMPMPDAGYRLLEPPHRGTRLRAEPLPPEKVARHSPIASVISTQGCKFNCSFCPIPAVNQRTWRHKSPTRLAEEIRHIHENFGIKHYFSTDDNFFNNRETVEELMTAMSELRTGGERLGRKIRFYTEATQFDVYKNRDLLRLCHRGGLRAIWFGIEDLTADLVNKGQNAEKTQELFKLLWEHGIQPMAMMIHSDDQPVRSEPGSLAGVINQAKFIFKAGAVSYQCTHLGPAVGTRDFERAAEARTMYVSVGGEPVPEAFQDGNHVVASRHEQPWRRQTNLIRAYASFYNPINLLRTIVGYRGTSVRGKRLAFQVLGILGLFLTIPKMLQWRRKLKRGPIRVWEGLPEARIPMIDPRTGQEICWGIAHRPSLPASAVSEEPAPMVPTPAIPTASRGPAVTSPTKSVPATTDR